MRKDSELFLKKVLNYRDNIKKDSFELNCKDFNEIPNIETAVFDIMEELRRNSCLTSKSEVIDLDGNISIYLTLDGITFFDEKREKSVSGVTLNVSGGQVNIANDRANITATMNCYSDNTNLDECGQDKLKTEYDIDGFDGTTPFFDYRFGKAFPSVRGIMEFLNPEECVDRLEILLKRPLRKKDMADPIWWLRRSSNNDISTFERLDKTKILINEKQLDVKKVIIYASPMYYKKFVYIETKPEEATGLYEKLSNEQIHYWVEQIGSYFEEYAIYKDKLIKRTEYDDGAAIIDGKVVDLENEAKIRTRYLTPYNFLICAKWNPLNEIKYDSRVEEILLGMLEGKKKFEELVDFIEKIPRHRNDSW